MKNSLSNIPFLKSWINYYYAIRHKVRSKNLQIGYLNEIRNCHFGLHNSLGQKVRLGNVKLDDYSYISYETVIQNATIGKFTSIGPRCQIGLGKHPTNLLSTHPLFYSKNPPINLSFLSTDTFEEFQPIAIGNDVWIGANVIILDGITIGDGAIIAAGAIVTNDVKPYAIVKGVPAKQSGNRFSEEEIKQLLNEQWWNKNISDIKGMIQTKIP